MAVHDRTWTILVSSALTRGPSGVGAHGMMGMGVEQMATICSD